MKRFLTPLGPQNSHHFRFESYLSVPLLLYQYTVLLKEHCRFIPDVRVVPPCKQCLLKRIHHWG